MTWSDFRILKQNVSENGDITLSFQFCLLEKPSSIRLFYCLDVADQAKLIPVNAVFDIKDYFGKNVVTVNIVDFLLENIDVEEMTNISCWKVCFEDVEFCIPVFCYLNEERKLCFETYKI